MTNFSMQGWIIVQRRRDGSFDPVKALEFGGVADASIFWSRLGAEDALWRVADDVRAHYMVAPVLVQGLPPESVK
jgi:hypothetical protein